MRALEPIECSSHSVANVEAASVDAHVASFIPAKVALQLVTEIETPAFDQALGKAKCHGGVVSPLPRFQLKDSSAGDSQNWFERAGFLELNCRTQCVSGGESQ